MPVRRSWGPRARSSLALGLMTLGILAVYYPLPDTPTDNALFGIDYHQLHARRIRFAQDALFSAEGAGTLPGWYPRELMGTPFWSNIQNFPFIPTRLAVLLTSDPLGALYAGVNLAAVLSGAFTFLYARRLGLGRTAAAGAGWTFACAGFFASRVMAGHLPLLEAYPALPLLLWLAECWLRPGSGGADAPSPTRQKLTLLALGLSTTCVALAGHPQLPFYAIATAGLYLLYRGPLRRGARGVAAMVAGGLCAAFAHVPFLALVRRSTRILALDPAANDIVLPYRRLAAILMPWIDGHAQGVAREGALFEGFPNDAYFWETVHYIGWVPLLAATGLLAWQIRRRAWRPPAPALFFAVTGVLALVTALPFVQDVVSRLPGTLLRSPSRQLYVTAFALALAFGAAVHLTLRHARPGRRWPLLAAAAALAIHALDLGLHDRAFVRMITIPGQRGDPFEQGVRRLVDPTARVAMDYTIPWPLNREIDDVGLFDSVMLARPYAGLLALSGQPPTLNIQELSGSDMTARALQAAGVRLVLTQRERPDLRLLGRVGAVQLYEVSDALPRVAYFPAERVSRLPHGQIDANLRDPRHDLRASLMLEQDAPAPATSPTSAPTTAPAPGIAYRRLSPDEMILEVNAPADGFLRILEAWDPGWSATVNGRDVNPVPADGFYLGIPVSAGPNEIRLTFSTPGRGFGMLVSLGGVVALLLVAFAPLRVGAPTPHPHVKTDP